MKDIYKHCNICESCIDVDNGDIVGNFGILPVAFCVWCYSNMVDMVEKLNGYDDPEILEEKLQNLKE
jgi:hypothetical protein